jgi:hypothetical protein
MIKTNPFQKYARWAGSMLALRSAERGFDGADFAPDAGPAPHPRASDWLPLQQAACELGVSPGTARRMIRRGELRNRIVPRPGGFAYLVYLPNSRHAQFAAHAHHATVDRRVAAPALPSWPAHLEAAWAMLSESIRRALRPPAPARPLRLVEADGPFARYRWLARRRRWWRF